MPSIIAFFYDKVMKATEQACLIDWRRELLKDVDGKVLEIGAGTGASIDLYPVKKSIELTLSEPEKSMREQLDKKIQQLKSKNIVVINSTAEEIISPDSTFDYVFMSLVCCSVQDVSKALKEIKRVLKPAGKFIFLEHVAAKPGTNRRKWQNRLNAIWRKIAGNCHLNRETEMLIVEAGFTIVEIKRESLRKALSIVRPSIRGVATY